MSLGKVIGNEAPTGAALRDPEAFATIVRQSYNRIYLTALAMVRQPEMAEDITQETFLRAWLKRDLFKGPVTGLPSWRVRIAQNLAIDWLRTGQQRSRVLPLISMESMPVEPVDKSQPDPRQSADQIEQNAQLSDALKTMPDDLRQVILLHYAEGMSPSDIARLNGEAASTVTRRLERARAQLRAHLESGLAAGLALMKPGPRGLEKTLALMGAAVALPAATRAQLLQLAADTPPPPMIDPVSSVAHGAASFKEAGIMKGIIAKAGLAKLLAGAAVLAAVTGGIYAVSGPGLAKFGSNETNNRNGQKTQIRAISGKSAAATGNMGDEKDTLANKAHHPKRAKALAETESRKSTSSTKSVTGATNAAADSAAPTLQKITVSGRVYDNDTSMPLAGVEINLFDNEKERYQAITGTDGSYQFSPMVMASDSWYLDASYDGYQLAANSYLTILKGKTVLVVNAPRSGDSLVRNLAMVPAVIISGHITDRAGSPVDQASLKWNGTISFGYKSGNEELARSDANGDFEFTVLPFQSGMVDVTAEGYAFTRTPRMTISNENVSSVSIVLDQGGIAEGHVVDENGKPVAEAILDTSDRLAFGNFASFPRRELARTDGDGHFKLASLSPGTTHFNASAEGYGPVETSVTLTAGERKTGLEVRLGSDLTIEGRVVGFDGNPTTAHINVQNGTSMFSGFSGKPQVTDKQGNFVLNGVAPGQVTLSVISHKPQLSKRVTVKAGTKDLVIKMDRGVVIHGRVVDASNQQPIEKFDVVNMGETFRDGEGPGGFRFFLEPGHSTYARITAEGYVTKTFEAVAPKDKDEIEIEFAMGMGSGVTGRVVSADTGKPLADVPVAVYETHSSRGVAAGNTVSDGDGKFLISGIPSGKLKVSVIPSSPFAQTSKKVDVKDGEFPDIGDIAVSTGGRIYGRAIDASTGKPPVNARIYFNGPKGTESWPSWDALSPSGEFDFSGLNPGTYDVAVNSTARTVELKSGDTREINFTLGGIIMRGTVTVDGQTTTVTIKARNLENSQLSNGRQSDSKGYILTNLSPGNYEITISADATPGASPEVLLHSEIVELPDQPAITKDFIVP